MIRNLRHSLATGFSILLISFVNSTVLQLILYLCSTIPSFFLTTTYKYLSIAAFKSFLICQKKIIDDIKITSVDHADQVLKIVLKK